MKRIYQEKEFFASMGILAIFVFIVVLLNNHGIRNRVLCLPFEAKVINRPAEAYSIWKGAGVRGRILYFFDRHLNMETPGYILSGDKPERYYSGSDMDKSLTEDNYLYISVRNNIARQIFHIVPDDAWIDVSRVLAVNQFVCFEDGIFKFYLTDIPVYVMRMRDIKPVSEKALILVNGEFWDNTEIDAIAGLLMKKVLKTDLLLLSGRISEDNIVKLTRYATNL